MFIANLLTAWVEALTTTFSHPDYPVLDQADHQMKDIPVRMEYPADEIHYPGLWVNFSMQGDVKNVGIGHVEHEVDGDGNYKEYFRWQFGGFVEITVGAMTNLERALVLDELLRVIAVGRVGKNVEGTLRETIQNHDLIGQRVLWESLTVSGFGEAQGTPWGTDDLIYEATVTITIEGEVVLDPNTGILVPLSGVVVEDLLAGEPGLPVPGVDGWS